jgi:hypothetical protein
VETLKKRNRPMAKYTMELGGLSNAQHVAERLDLQILPHLGAVAACRQAIDTCASSRQGVTLTGPKGIGKTVGIQDACAWFAQIEREKRTQDAAYRVRRVLRFGHIRCKTDREVALLLARRLDPRYSERANGRKKTVAEIRAEIVSMCLRQQYAVIIVDEVETFAAEALLFFRDLLRDARDGGSETVAGTSMCLGVGILLVGDDSFDPPTGLGAEAGQRWSKAVELPAPGICHVVELLGTWFPGFQPHIDKVGDAAWANYLNSVVARGHPLSLRQVENIARHYALYVVRTDPKVSSREEIGFNRHLFELTAEECSWAQKTPAGKPAKGRRSTGGGSS